MVVPGTRLLVAFATFAWMAAASAAYPDKPIRLVTTAPPGGTIDFIARAIAPAMGEDLGQQVVVDNRAGASGALGADLVAKAAPDGYTALLMEHGQIAVNASVRKDMPFDVTKDLLPVSLVATLPTMMVAYPGFAPSTLKDLVAAAKREPGKIAYATPGVGTPHHLAAVLLSRSAGIELNHVPYKGGGPMTADVVAGQVPVLFTGATALLPFVKSGRLKPLAVASPQRLPQLPDVPTFIESGFADFEVQVLFSIWLPAKTPPEVAARLGHAVQRALADREVRRKLEEQTLTVVGSTPEQLRVNYVNQFNKWGELIRASGIVLD